MSRLSLWLARRLPPQLMADTERIGLSLAFIAVGILSIISSAAEKPTGLVEATVPPIAYYEWTITLIAGGVLTIIGLWIGHRWTERFGVMLAGTGCLTYGLALLGWASNPRQYISGVLFLLLALVKLIRLVVSTAAAASSEEPHD